MAHFVHHSARDVELGRLYCAITGFAIGMYFGGWAGGLFGLLIGCCAYGV